MKKAVILLSCMIFLLIAIGGCSRGKSGHEAGGRSGGEKTAAETNVQAIQEHGMLSVTIYKSEGFGTVGQTRIRTLTDEEQLSDVLTALTTATKIEGTLDVSAPDFDFVVKLHDGSASSFHFWLRDGLLGMYTDIKDTGQGYTLSEASTSVLLKYVN